MVLSRRRPNLWSDCSSSFRLCFLAGAGSLAWRSCRRTISECFICSPASSAVSKELVTYDSTKLFRCTMNSAITIAAATAVVNNVILDFSDMAIPALITRREEGALFLQLVVQRLRAHTEQFCGFRLIVFRVDQCNGNQF